MAVKAWSELTPAYRKRLQAKGLTATNYRTPQGASLRQAARGHGKTPEHPERIRQHPEKYPEYIERREATINRIMARKSRIYSSVHKWKPGSARDYLRNPRDRDDNPMSISATRLRQIAAMTDDQIMSEASRLGGEWSRYHRMVAAGMEPGPPVSSDEMSIFFYH
jgi:hypothetical protein